MTLSYTNKQYGLTLQHVSVVDLLSLVLSKKEIDVSLLTVLAMAGYSSLFESTL